MYKNTQIGYFLIVANLIVLLLLSSAFSSTETDGVGIWGLAIIFLLFLFLFVLFFSLTVKVTDNEVIWYFGPGLWKYSIQLDKIMDVSVERTNPLEGIGIRSTTKGLLYHVSGFNAVNIIKIGSNQPNKFAESIRKNADI